MSNHDKLRRLYNSIEEKKRTLKATGKNGTHQNRFYFLAYET